MACNHANVHSSTKSISVGVWSFCFFLFKNDYLILAFVIPGFSCQEHGD